MENSQKKQTTYTHLKQKKKVSEWMFQETGSYYEKHGRMPTEGEAEHIVGRVYEKIKDFPEQIPFDNLLHVYLIKLPQYEARIKKCGISGDKQQKKKNADAPKKKKGNSNRICPACGRKMKQQFIGLQHCKCGISWKKDIGFFERNGSMVFALERRKTGKKYKQCPVIRWHE